MQLSSIHICAPNNGNVTTLKLAPDSIVPEARQSWASHM